MQRTKLVNCILVAGNKKKTEFQTVTEKYHWTRNEKEIEIEILEWIVWRVAINHLKAKLNENKTFLFFSFEMYKID